MRKYIFLFTLLAFAVSLHANEDKKNEIITRAIKTFSVSPFETFYFEGGAFFSGDGVSEMPATIRFNSKKYGAARRINGVDGLFGNTMFDIKINGNMANVVVADWDLDMQSSMDKLSFETPILIYPKIYTDVLMYVFIDNAKDIVKKAITIGSNWNILKLDYKDRVDTITFSAKTMRVRTYVSEYYDNKLTIDFAAYTNIDGKSFPTSFILKSSSDKREVRLNVSTIFDGKNISKAPKDFINN